MAVGFFTIGGGAATETNHAVTPLTPAPSFALIVAFTFRRLTDLSSARPGFVSLITTLPVFPVCTLNVPLPTRTLVRAGFFFEPFFGFAWTRTSKVTVPAQSWITTSGQLIR